MLQQAANSDRKRKEMRVKDKGFTALQPCCAPQAAHSELGPSVWLQRHCPSHTISTSRKNQRASGQNRELFVTRGFFDKPKLKKWTVQGHQPQS